ncbi:hypothetical protein MMC07_003666 [Pseudocyphellaria aurata]|nr:hypothetical protein [Pseudocyphellaria aurata]
MASIVLRKTTLLNRTGNSAVITVYFESAPPVQIQRNEELVHFTATIASFFLSDPEVGVKISLVPESDIKTRPGSVISLARDDQGGYSVNVYTNEARPEQIRLRPSDGPTPGDIDEYNPVSVGLYEFVKVMCDKVILMSNFESTGARVPFPKAARLALFGPGTPTPPPPTHTAAGARTRATAFAKIAPAFAKIAPTSKKPGPPIPASGDKFDQLVNILQGSDKGVTSQVKSGKAPLPVSINVVDSSFTTEDQLKNYTYLIEMTSLTSLWIGIYLVQLDAKRGRTEPLKITDPKEAPQAFADIADATYQAMLHPLSGYYNISVGSSQHYEQTLSIDQVHVTFLEVVFGSFKLGKTVLDELEGVLNKFMSDVGKIEVDTSDNIAHTVRLNQVVKLNISGDDDNPSWVYQPVTKLIYLSVESESYQQATRKWWGSRSEEKFRFAFDYVIVEATLNPGKYLEDRPKLDKAFEFVTQKNLKDFGTDVTQTVGDKPPQKKRK